MLREQTFLIVYDEYSWSTSSFSNISFGDKTTFSTVHQDNLTSQLKKRRKAKNMSDDANRIFPPKNYVMNLKKIPVECCHTYYKRDRILIAM